MSFKLCFRYFSYQQTLTLRPHILFILEIFYIIRNIFFNLRRFLSALYLDAFMKYHSIQQHERSFYFVATNGLILLMNSIVFF